MSRVAARAIVSGSVTQARALWFDLARWPSFVDGFGHVVRVDEGWPTTGRLIWDSIPRGRGRVVEAAADGALTVEDARLAGTQRVRFEPAGEGQTEVVVELDYRLKHGTPVSGLVDALFVRRAVADALRRTLARYAVECDAHTAGDWTD